eukprot:CAMPEP_0177720918 /NCGR_PEP_ID=MMETSP0484_2-20121128/16869_1 /TAXON_ID=354590 /ORGANISM="Rhodomonas lens, Strain RHODO" /LENGTH=196 /DNA_ID=CAMNT_0019233187 /DNA_START=654 /DNA_END=1245 /DNA_ORIENTATION=-
MTLLAEGHRARDLRADDGTTTPLGGFAHPVIPVRLRPPRPQLLPEVAGEEPAEAAEEVRAQHLRGVAAEGGEAVVVPGADRPQRRVALKQPRPGSHVGEEVRGHLQVILQHDRVLEPGVCEHLVEAPAVVACDLVVAVSLPSARFLHRPPVHVLHVPRLGELFSDKLLHALVRPVLRHPHLKGIGSGLGQPLEDGG